MHTAISHTESPLRRDIATRPLCRAEYLPYVLRRERARADRIHSGFCVVLFGPRRSRSDADLIRGLGEIVVSRARETDEVCLVRGSFVCAILPDTPITGGRRFAQAVWASLNGQADRAVFEVLCYPSTAFDESAPNFASPACMDSARALREKVQGDGANYGLDRNGNDNAAHLLADFLRHVTSAAPRLQRNGNVQSLDFIFATPLPLWKRTMDVLFGGMALLMLSPLMLLIAVAVLVTSGRPIIFRQRRAGLLGRPFEIYKFRTMVTDAEKRQSDLRHISEQDGPAFKLTNDPRVTRLGRILRKTSLDELPQLWNVLKGDMSLVGPRPLPCGEADACSQWQRRRLDVTPGITCIWQVKGRSRVSFPEWMRMDIAYVRSRRLVRDIALLLLTVPAVLLRRGAK